MTRKTTLIRVGYVPYSRDLKHPADRRRLASWALERKVPLHITDPLNSDALVLSNAANFGYWIKQSKQPVILDLVDGYLGEKPSLFRDFSRNILRTIRGTSSLNWLTYTEHLKEACRQSAAVVVASPEQRDLVLPYNPNVFVILDDHSELDVLRNTKTSLGIEHQLCQHDYHLFWEGFGFTIKHFQEISVQLDKFLAQNNVGMYVVTNTEFPKWGGYLGAVKTESLIKKLFPISFSSIHILPWSLGNLGLAASQSFLGIIPINFDDKFAQLKSENKLLSMWHLGLPVICSPTPAYLRVFKDAGIQVDGNDPIKWIDLISDSMFIDNKLNSQKSLADLYIMDQHTRKILAGKWDEVFNTVIS